MKGQTAIPVPQGPTALGVCRWCGEPATELLEIEPAKMGTSKGQRVLKRPALEAPVCKEHAGIVSRQPIPCTCSFRQYNPNCKAKAHPCVEPR